MMVKIWLALGVAAAAALLVILAGLLLEVRVTVALYRAAVVFVVAGSVAYGAALLLTQYGTQHFLGSPQADRKEWLSEAGETADETGFSAAAGKNETAETNMPPAAARNDGAAKEKNFSPLTSADLRHVSTTRD